MGSSRPEQPAISEYGVIGDCRAAALISKYGSIDWLCWPRFDSPSIFAAILDREKGGHWSISPLNLRESTNTYVEGSNVLETTFQCSHGRATLTDLMPVVSDDFKRNNIVPDHELVRQLTCTEGEIEVAIDFQPRANYGASTPQIREVPRHGLRIDIGRGAYWLRPSVPLQISKNRAHARLSIQRGDALQFSLSYAEESPTVLPALGNRVREAIECSVQWWQQWAARSKYNGPYRGAVTRSSLALKLLAYAPSGAIVAAPTTSLPERLGDTLNWDYRYCWLRDASLTTRALLGLGYMEEAAAFLTWLLHATRLTQPELQVLYTVFGRLAPRERELKYLQGFRNSQPIRIGNGARRQLQLDVYGQVIDAAAQYAQKTGAFDKSTQTALKGFGKYVAGHWDLPDEGIWEPRCGRSNHTHSRLLCWTALDRLLALEDKKLIHDIPHQWFAAERERIRQQIEERAWNSGLKTYASTLEGDAMDASLLRIPWYGLEAADSPRMKATYGKLCEALGAGNGLLFRYARNPPEGAFGICGFWAVEYLALGGGTLEQANSLFRQLLAYANHLGLYSEETDPATSGALGNFPQAFTHVGLVSAALTLEEQERGKGHPAVHTGSDVKATKT